MQSDEMGLASLLRSRIGVEFDGEAHLTDAEAQSIAAAIERLVAERDEAQRLHKSAVEAGMAASGELANAEAERDEARAELKKTDGSFDIATRFNERHIATVEAQRDKLKEALKPFAEYARLDSGRSEREGVVGISSPEGSIDITFGDFARARQALGDT